MFRLRNNAISNYQKHKRSLQCRTADTVLTWNYYKQLRNFITTLKRREKKAYFTNILVANNSRIFMEKNREARYFKNV